MTEGYLERVQRESQEEAAAIVADLQRLRFRADQVAHVLRALKLPVPSELNMLLGFVSTPEGFKPVIAEQPVEVAVGPVAPGETVPRIEQTVAKTPEGAERIKRMDEALDKSTPPAAVTGTQRTAEQESKPEPASLEIPDHLKGMPAARKGVWRPKSMLPAAERQLKVLEFVREHPDMLVPEIAEDMQLDRAAVERDTKELKEVGLLVPTGLRLPRGKKRGRAGIKLRVADAVPPTTSGRQPDAAPAGTDTEPASGRAAERPTTARGDAASTPGGSTRGSEPSGTLPEVDQATLNLVRAAYRDRAGKQVAPQSLARTLGLNVKKVQAATDVLAATGALVMHGVGPGRTYKWVKPTEPGRASELDQQRARDNAERQRQRESSAPVAGTGNRPRASNQDVDKLLADCSRAGATISHDGGHFVITWANGTGNHRVAISSTPRDRRSVLNDRARLRRGGLQV